MTASANAAQLAAIGRLHAVLVEGGVEHWFFGGWAVDLHLGSTSREHADVDIAVWVDDRVLVETLLVEAGWRHTPDPEEDGYTAYQRGAVRVEAAFLERDSDGSVYTPLAVGRGTWRTGSFGDEQGEIDGVKVPVVSREALLQDKTGPRADPVSEAKDRADVALLSAARSPVQAGVGGSIVGPGGTPCASRRS